MTIYIESIEFASNRAKIVLLEGADDLHLVIYNKALFTHFDHNFNTFASDF